MDNSCERNLYSSQPDNGRRCFLKTSFIGGVSLFCLPFFENLFLSNRTKLNYDLSLDAPTRLFDGKYCWVHARTGILQGAGKEGMPRVVMTMNLKDLSGSDIFKGMYGLHTNDLGLTWTRAEKLDSLEPRWEMIDGVKRPVACSDFFPGWHKTSKVLLGTGHTVVYTPEWRVTRPRPRHTSFSWYNPDDNVWSGWQKLEMPDPERFCDAGAGSVQRYDKSDGTILLPIHFRPFGEDPMLITVLWCSFDGRTLGYLGHGNELSVDDETRGIGEGSVTFYEGEYFMTIRNDKQGYVARSQDGLNYLPMQPWKFDDGSDLGNYNTQQNWVTHSDGLFLVYTRRGANNDHVFRHRAPLFIAQVDSQNLTVIRETERILVPERGARLGNFGVTDVSSDETWVTAAEWMQPRGVEKYGSDGSVFVARIYWNKPNRLFRS